MSDGARDLVLEMLRAIRTDIAEVKERLGILAAQYASLSRRVDRLAGDVEQVKRRLGPVAA
jgi:predicted nuclease with TOPRIM domain